MKERFRALERLATGSPLRPQPFQSSDLLLHPLVGLTAGVLAEEAVENLNSEIPLDDVRDALVLEEAGERRETQVWLGGMPSRGEQEHGFHLGASLPNSINV